MLLEPYHYLSRQPGKEFRTKMIEAFDKWLQVPSDRLAVIKNVVQMLHDASLLIDDVEDGSDLRRGIPVAHKIYGVPMTINCANYVYFLALEEIHKLDNPKMLKIFTEELLDLHRGQGMDLFWRDNLACPTEESYIDMVDKKTGGLLRLAVKLMQEASPKSIDLVPLVNVIGVYFQIRDDYMNLQSTEYTNNKGFCEDLTEGKFSFPVVHSIHADQSNRTLLNILKQRPIDIDVKRYAVKLMYSTGSFAYTLEYLGRVEAQARTMIRELGGNDDLVWIMDYLSKGLSSRQGGPAAREP